MSKPVAACYRAAVTTVLLSAFAGAAHAQSGLQITEWMYSGAGGEFIELTNYGPAPVDMTGYVYDDDSRIPTAALGGFDIGGFGTVAPGQSVILTESTAAAFRAAWSLPASVVVVGGYTNNIGRNDEINIFDASGALVDRLTYGDTAFPGTIRTLERSGNPGTFAVLNGSTSTGWVLSSVGDPFGSYANTGGAIGNPGIAPIPEPQAAVFLLAGLGAAAFAARRRARRAAEST